MVKMVLCNLFTISAWLQVLPMIPRGDGTFSGGVGAPSSTSVAAMGAEDASLLGTSPGAAAADGGSRAARRHRIATIGASVAAAVVLLICAAAFGILHARRRRACGRQQPNSSRPKVRCSACHTPRRRPVTNRRGSWKLLEKAPL